MSLIAVQRARRAPDVDAPAAQRVEVARERALEVLAQAVGIERREEADLAEVDREDRHPGAGVARAAR